MARHARLVPTGSRSPASIHAQFRYAVEKTERPSGSSEPVRTCVGCRQRDLRSVLLRLVVERSAAPTGRPTIMLDAGRSLPGRGAWIHPGTRCFTLAERRRAVQRALRVANVSGLDEIRAALMRTEMGARAQSRPGLPGRNGSYVDKEAGWKPMGTR